MADRVAGFILESRDEKFLRGWVSSEEILQQVIEAHSINTGCQFVSWHDDRKKKASEQYTGRLFWKHKDIPITGYPFSLGRHIIKQCQYGKTHKRGQSNAKTVTDVHNYAKGQRFCIQPTRKIGCAAQIVIRYVVIHNEEKYSSQDLPQSSRKRQEILHTISCHMQQHPDYKGEEKIFVSLPLDAAHNHKISQESSLSNRINEKVRNKIYETVNSGITNTTVIKRILKSFVEADFRNKDIKPSVFDRAFYPLSKDIKNHVHKAIASGTLSALDQENLRRKIDEWKREKDCCRHFFFRPATEGTEDNAGDNFLFIHQEEWQSRLMERYGNTVSLLDATYRTTKYSLPLFMVVVRTNVEYIPVAEFVTEDETTESIKEALQILKSWNPSWCPGHIMLDYSEAEINAVKAEFESAKVLLCAFHREQAWERWARSEKNIPHIDKDEFLSTLRNVAYCTTNEEYELAEESLRSCHWFKHPVKNYIEHKWLSVKEYWCNAFMDFGFHLPVTTTNGVESLNKSLKHFYLKLANPGTLSTLMRVVIQDFLPDLFQNYVMLNYRASSNFKAYDASIPNYLHNRPRTVVEHCMKRLHSIDHFGSGDINIRIDGTSEAYTVKSMDKTYQVTMGSEKEFPNCTCEDFRRNFLPCKHFFAVFKFSKQSWNNLSPLYIESPFLNLDFGAIKTITKEHVSSDKANPNLCTGVENQEKDAAGLQEITKLQRDVVAILKVMQNKTYICSNNDALSKCIPILESANDILSANAEKQEGLPLGQEDKLRNLPRRKKHFKRLGKFQTRVGKKAKTMREASVLDIDGVEDYMGDGDVWRETREGSLQVDCIKGKKKANLSLKLKKKKQEKHEEHSDFVVVEENVKEIIEPLKLTQTFVEQDDTNALKLVMKLWSLKEDNDIPVAKVGGKNVCDTDIRSLRPGQWLTDMVMDSYISLLALAQNDMGKKVVDFVHTKMTSIIEGAFRINKRDGSRKNIKEIEELNADIILGTYYRSSHWTLVVVEMKLGKVYFYNPCGEKAAEMKKIERNWRKYIEDLQALCGTSHLPPREWTVTCVAHSKQRDSYNCGVYCLIFAEKHLSNRLEDLNTINESNLKKMRMIVAKHLMLYEVYLTGCCPKCGFDIANEEFIKCKTCHRSFHFRSYCIEEELKNLGESERFQCKLCKINWPVLIDRTVEEQGPEEKQEVQNEIQEKEEGGTSFQEKAAYAVCVDRKESEVERPAEVQNLKGEEKRYFFRANAGQKRKRSSFLYSDIRGRYPTSGKRENLEEKTPPTCGTKFVEQKLGSSRVDLSFIKKEIPYIEKELVEIMNCAKLKCMEANHERHHAFLCDPSSFYERERLNFAFGSSYFTVSVLEHLQIALGEHMSSRKMFPGSIYNYYYSFKDLKNNILEKLLKEYPTIGMHYLTHVLLKEAIVLCVCLKTGLPLEEADKRCKETETSMRKIKKNK